VRECEQRGCLPGDEEHCGNRGLPKLGPWLTLATQRQQCGEDESDSYAYSGRALRHHDCWQGILRKTSVTSFFAGGKKNEEALTLFAQAEADEARTPRYPIRPSRFDSDHAGRAAGVDGWEFL
jgi:hypothetical protein